MNSQVVSLYKYCQVVGSYKYREVKNIDIEHCKVVSYEDGEVVRYEIMWSILQG